MIHKYLLKIHTFFGLAKIREICLHSSSFHFDEIFTYQKIMKKIRQTLFTFLICVTEIGLPKENGRAQILTIHTRKMRANEKLHKDVDLKELAALTKNFSGAEIEGLVRAAQSRALNRYK